jgi:oligopeptide transport system permease protein
VISTLVIVFISVPSYVYAFLVQYFLCFKWGLFPLQLESLTNASFFSWPMFRSMVPAIFSLSFGVIAGLTRYTRAELSEVLTGDYMLLARTKGLTKAQAISRHALRNAMVVILPMIIGEFIGILGGSMIIENMFGIPGIGNTFINSINVRDYNFFMALTVFYTFIGLASGILIDISYGFIDPRIRMGSRK